MMCEETIGNDDFALFQVAIFVANIKSEERFEDENIVCGRKNMH